MPEGNDSCDGREFARKVGSPEGGAMIGAVVRVRRLRFGFGGWGIVMRAGLVGMVEEEGEGR